MYKLLIIPFLLIGCSKTIIPETGNQVQVVMYSELTNLTLDVSKVCREKVISKETCTDLHSKLSTAKNIIDSEGGTNKAADILNYVRSKL